MKFKSRRYQQFMVEMSRLKSAIFYFNIYKHSKYDIHKCCLKLRMSVRDKPTQTFSLLPVLFLFCMEV